MQKNRKIIQIVIIILAFIIATSLVVVVILKVLNALPSTQANLPSIIKADFVGDPVILAAGDIACGARSLGAPCKQADTADLVIQNINTNPVKGVLVLGDSQYEAGNINDYKKYYASTWGKFYDITYPVPGNHEYLTKNGAGFFEYFSGTPTSSKGYYSFKIGSWWIYALNSNCAHVGGCKLDSPQEVWFKNQLQEHANDGTCQLMFMHYPYLSSDKREFSFYNDLDQIWRDFYNAGGDIDLAGHSHTYERFAPMKVIGINGNASNAADSAKGITEFVVGTGGRNSYGFGKIAPNSAFRTGNVFGVIKLTLHENNADWQFISSTQRKTTADSSGGSQVVTPNQILDSGTLTCH